MSATTHAQLGASGAKRWMGCSGSLRMSKGIADTTSEYAIEGSAAHELAEEFLRNGEDPTREWAVGGVPVTQEMVEAVQVYIDFVREAAVGGELFIEQQVSLEALGPPLPMFGTTDAAVWHEDSKILHVIDYKHGAGVAVDVIDNPQPMYYALGTIVDTLKKRPDLIRLTIVQPRGHHPDGLIRSHDVTWDELVEFKKTLFAAAEATQDPDAPLAVGDWCRFCPALASCPANHDHAVALAQSEFDTIDDVSDLPTPEALTTEAMTRVLDGAGAVRDWLRAIEAHIIHMIDVGEDVPGYKLVQGRANRQWHDPEKVDKYLARRGLRVGQRFKKVLVSPAQAEKALKGTKGPELPERLYHKPEGKKKLVPDADARPALPASATEDFTEFM